MELSASHRRFLLIDQGIGPTLFNFVLNGAIAWLLFRSIEPVPLWGGTSIASDTLATAFLLPFATCLVVSRIVAHQVSVGRIEAPPRSPTRLISFLAARQPLRRGAWLGLAGVLLAALPVLGWFAIGGPEGLAFSSFLWFKASFAAVLAALVTPMIAWVALLTAPPARRAS